MYLSSQAALSRILYTRHAQDASQKGNSSRQKVDSIDRTEGHTQARKLFEPGVEVCSRHEQHPTHQPGDHQRYFNADAGLLPRGGLDLLLRLSSAILLLDIRTSNEPVGRQDASRFAQPFHLEEQGEHFQRQHRRAEDEKEDVSAYIVSAFPLPADGFAGRMREDGVKLLSHTTVSSRPCGGGFHCAAAVGVAYHLLALPTRPPKRPVDDGGAEEPLRHSDPYQRDAGVSKQGLQALASEDRPQRRAEVAIADEQEEEGQRRPEPSDLDEIDVEGIGLLREV